MIDPALSLSIDTIFKYWYFFIPYAMFWFLSSCKIMEESPCLGIMCMWLMAFPFFLV